MQLCHCPFSFFLFFCCIVCRFQLIIVSIYSCMPGYFCPLLPHRLSSFRATFYKRDLSTRSLSGEGGGKQNPWLCEELQEHIMIMARLATKKYGRENRALVLGHSVPSEVVRECLQVCCSLKRSWVLAGDNRVLFFLG